MKNDAWEGTVEKKSRGLLDGSNMYRRLTIRQLDGSTVRVRVGRELWDAVSPGDVVSKAAGHDPARQQAQ